MGEVLSIFFRGLAQTVLAKTCFGPGHGQHQEGQNNFGSSVSC